MNTLRPHVLAAATAALAVAGALTMVSQDAGASVGNPVSHAAPVMAGDAVLLAAADMLCAVVSGS